MDCEIVKGKPLSKDEAQLLLDLIESSKIITTKATNATNNKLKNDEWNHIAEKFNAASRSCYKTPQQLRLKWENLKKNSRKRSSRIRMNHTENGDGPAEYIPPDVILDRVAGLLESTASGVSVSFGDDKEIAGFDVGGDDSEDVTTVSQNDQNFTTPNKKRLAFSTPRTVKRIIKPDDGRTARNMAIGEYYSSKKRYLDAKFKNIYLENDNLKLHNEKLKLENEKLKLELEKLKEQYSF